MTSMTDTSRSPSDHFLKPTRSVSSKNPTPAIVSRSRSPTQSAKRPSLHEKRPSWVGPPAPSRPAPPGIPNMTQKVKITYSHAGLQPPVYIAGSLGDQPWEPVEMHFNKQENGEHDFWQEFDVEEGEYQYKFRLGPGDWWALDESKHIVDDGAGNRNNLLVVKPQPSQDSHASHPVQTNGEVAHEPELAVPTIKEPGPEHSASKSHALAEAPATVNGLPAYESPILAASDQGQQNDAEQAPVFAHEAAASSSADAVKSFPQDEEEQHAPFFRHETAAAAAGSAVFEDEDEEDYVEEPSSPLLRHETLAPIRTNHYQNGEVGAPLFRHESLSPIEARSSSRSARSDSASSHHERNPFDDDIHDPSLEKFPTDRDDILAHLQRVSSRTALDDHGVEVTPSSPALSSTRSLSAAASPSLSIPRELDCIDEDEELSPVVPSASEGLGITPSKESSVSATVTEENGDSIEDTKDSAPKLSISPRHEAVNRGPLTPPMTPIDELQAFPKSQGPASPKASKPKSNDNAETRSTSKSTLSSGGDDSKVDSFWSWIGKVCADRVGTLGIAVAVGFAAAFYAMTGRNSST